jgi:hypothetical protein
MTNKVERQIREDIKDLPDSHLWLVEPSFVNGQLRPIELIASIPVERMAIDSVKWLEETLNATRIIGDPKPLFFTCLNMLKVQFAEIERLDSQIKQFSDEGKNAVGMALGSLKVMLADRPFKAYLCDCLAPIEGTDHGLRHALQVFLYGARLAELEFEENGLGRVSLHRLAWMALWHDVAYLQDGHRHAYYSALLARCLLRAMVSGEWLPSLKCPLTGSDFDLIGDGIRGHEKSLQKEDPVYENNALALAIRDADLLASTLHFDRFIRIAQLCAFGWDRWRFFDPSVNVADRLAILKTGKRGTEEVDAVEVDAVLDFVKNMFWKKQRFFLQASREIACEMGVRDPDDLLNQIEIFVKWAEESGMLPRERLKETRATAANLPAIDDCVRTLYERIHVESNKTGGSPR